MKYHQKQQNNINNNEQKRENYFIAHSFIHEINRINLKIDKKNALT